MNTLSEKIVEDLLKFTGSFIDAGRFSHSVPLTLLEKHLELLRETKRLVNINPDLARIAILRESEIEWAISQLEECISAALQRVESGSIPN